MKTTVLSFACAALLLGALPAAADDTFIAEQKPTEYLAKDRLIGAKVHDKDGKIIGDIEDMIINGDHQVVGVIMGVGGFLGAGEKKVAVTTSSLSLEATEGKLNVVMPTASKEVLTAAPAYKRINPPKGWLQRAVEKGQELKDKTSVTAKDALEAAKKEAGPALEKAKEAAKAAVDKAKDAAKPTEAPKE
jgi:sporulation protein YlmC with PRC-barrel domain